MQELGPCCGEGIEAHGHSLILVARGIDAQGEDFNVGPIETSEVRSWELVVKGIGNHARMK